MTSPTALVIGAGPAGIMAAEEMAQAGLSVTVAEAMPTVGRKFLMAGKSGLNLTMELEAEPFLAGYYEAAPKLSPMITQFGPAEVCDWARGLGQPVFAGTSGRVFPEAMKASPLLRAWVARLTGLGVRIRTRTRWRGFDGAALVFDTPDGVLREEPTVTILALGGASWARLGSDAAWVPWLEGAGVRIAPFRPANMGFTVGWSPHMARYFGQPVKGIALIAGSERRLGECVISQRGLEGSGIYAASRAVRDGAPLAVDLAPGKSLEALEHRLTKPRGKESLSNYLRKRLGFDPVKLALLQEFGRPLPDGPALAALVKHLPIAHQGPRPLDEAISVAGGVRWDAVDESLMLQARPGTFVAGEMLDWEAPTGGYLITACLATGRWAGRKAAAYAQRDQSI